MYQYASGPPCDYAYDDLSALLRQVLSTERSRKSREGNGQGHKPPPKGKVRAPMGLGKAAAKKHK